MDTFEFYGGVNEIGGNKIKLNQDKSSLFLDFGMSFSANTDYYSDFLNPRKLNGLGDFLELGLIPNIKGIYREDYLKHMGLNYEDTPSVDGLLLSHAHADHANYISHLRKDIPLYMSEKSRMILEVMEATSSSTPFSDIINYKNEFQYIPKKRGEGFKKLTGNDAIISRDVQVMKPYKKYNINTLNVTLLPVDHSLPGACSYFIESGNVATVYSGDLRFHGRNKDSTYSFVKKASKFSPTTMLCEGTRIHSESTETEENIEEYVYNLIKKENIKSLILANFPLRDLDRLVTFYNIAKNTDRILVINLKQAYMLKLIEKEKDDEDIYPKLKDESIAIYIPRRKSGSYTQDSYSSYNGNWEIQNSDEAIKDYDNWQRDFLNYTNTVTYKDLKEEGSKYIFRCDYFTFNELIDIKPYNAIYIHSMTEPFNEEMQIDFEKVENWLNHFNIKIYKKHVSGHASGPQLLDMIREIQPEILYPIHTEHVEMFDILKDDGINVIHPKKS